MLGEILFPAIQPWLVDLGFLQLRWYGLMFVVGFFVGQAILVRLARAKFLPVTDKQAADLVLWLVLGVLLGGRIGYCVFYRPDLLTDPLQLVRVWEGGLSFHGGLIGVCLTFLWFARRHKVSAWRVGDCCALAVTPGIFAVRCANFVNGELYGRIASAAVPWAMRFPTDPEAQRLLRVPPGASMHERELLILKAYGDGTWERIRPQVPLRHPSQVYEALGEGVLLGLFLLVLYRATRSRPLGPGAYGGAFVAAYGAVRFFLEYFRQPDSQFASPTNPLGTVFVGMSMGQVLCAGMIVLGGAILVRGLRQGRAP